MKKVSNVRRCRLCASEDVLNNFYNIFDDNSELKLEMKIRKLLPVVVMSWDPMPHVVCHDCTDKLNTFNEFYETSLNTERFLRTLHPLREAPARRLSEKDKGPEERRTPGAPGETSDLLVTPLNCREYVYTCRRCCRTFTKESSATVHLCSGGAKDTRELETPNKKSLPPLRIRLFDVSSGSFVCCLCKTGFEDKEELGKHIKGHFLEGNWGEEDEDEEEAMTTTTTTEEAKCNKEGRRSREGDERRQLCADRFNSSSNRKSKRRRKRGLRSPKKKRAKIRRLLEHLSGTGEESGTREKICPTSGSSTTETTEDQAESSKSDFSQERDVEMTDDSKSVTDEPGEAETSKAEDEVTVIEVVENRIPTNLSSCVFCDKIFATTESLLAHRSKHLADFRSDSGGGDPFQCDVCPRTFPSEWALTEHLRGHRGGLLEGGREPSLNGFSLGTIVSRDWGIVTSGEEDIPLVDVT